MVVNVLLASVALFQVFFFFTTEVVVAGIILCSLRGEGLLQEGVGGQCGGDCGRQLCYFSLQLTSLFLSLR